MGNAYFFVVLYFFVLPTAYIRINLAPKDIARRLNIDAKSIKMLKCRLKKKLQLDEDVDLEFFVKTF